MEVIYETLRNLDPQLHTHPTHRGEKTLARAVAPGTAAPIHDSPRAALTAWPTRSAAASISRSPTWA